MLASRIRFSAFSAFSRSLDQDRTANLRAETPRDTRKQQRHVTAFVASCWDKQNSNSANCNGRVSPSVSAFSASLQKAAKMRRVELDASRGLFATPDLHTYKHLRGDLPGIITKQHVGL